MKNSKSPASNARRLARRAASLIFTLALVLAGLAPRGVEVEAKSRTKSHGRARVAATNAKSRVAKRGEKTAREEREGSERFDAPGDGEEGEGDNFERREEWFRFQRAYPFADIPADARRQAWESRPRGNAVKDGDGRGILSVDAAAWTPLGPLPTTPKFLNNWGKTSGRINAIAVKPDDANVVLVGASTGGVWRSVDGGANFAPASDSQVDLSVASIAFAPSNPSIVYAGMGDIGNSYLGTGVLKSTDGGATWTRVSRVLGTDCATLPAFGTAGCLPAPGIAMAVAVDPNDANRVYLAEYLYSTGGFSDPGPVNSFTAAGFYISTDGGVNWTQTLKGLPRDIAIKPGDSQTIYAAMRRVDTNVDGVNSPGIYKSTNAGLSWARIYTSPFTSTRDIRVAVTPAAPDNVYVLVGTTASPATVVVNKIKSDGTALDSFTSANVDTGQFGYNTYIAVDPANANTIYVGTRDVYRSTDGGSTWASVTKNFTGSTFSSYNPFGSVSHPDQHSFAFSPGNSQTFYVGNDGGLSKTVDGGVSFASLNSTLTLSQFVGFVASPTDPNLQVGGTQDNGTQVRLAGGNGIGWTEFAEGDGGHPVINPVNPVCVLSTYVYGNIRRWQFNADGTRTEKGGAASNSTFGESSSTPRINFYAPFTSNGVDATVYFGTWKLFVSQNFADTVNTFAPTWNAPGGTTDLTRGGGDVLNAIGVQHSAYSSSQVIYTGSSQGRVMISQDGGATWTDVTTGLPNRTIESITVDPSNAATAYVTLGGYGTGHVFKTTNAGQTWTDLSGTTVGTKLPNVPTSALLLDPTTPGVIYVGTDIGVFRTVSGGGTWETFNNGLPPVPVSSFAVSAAGKIQIGTYGRGAYELNVVNTPTVQFALASQTASEASGDALIAVTRAGDLSSTSSVTVRTLDDQRAIPCNDTTTAPGVAFARCDYATTIETVTFAPGESSKSVAVPLVNDSYVEPNESVQLALSNAVNAGVGAQATTTLVITSDDAAGAQNPYFDHNFFVRQHYLDFLSREPDADGFASWTGLLSGCAEPYNSRVAPYDPVSNPSALCDRINVSANFFLSAEFQLKGGYVFRFYKASLGRLPTYVEMVSDMRSVTGSTPQEVFAKKAAYADSFVQRTDFGALYNALSNTSFVNALMDRYGLSSIRTPNPASPDDSSDGNKVVLSRNALVGSLDAGTLTRAQAVRAIADSNEVSGAEFNSAFVSMQYFGYLRRDPDQQGYNDWLGYLSTHPGQFRTMVFGFLYSPEYKSRFGTP